ncbi:MAG: HAMP domain-containing protein [Lysinibacillus sp.]|nr:HAMP domain-containing protein [Lysinibacillus sp.]
MEGVEHSKPKYSIRRKFIGLFLLVSIVPLLLVTFIIQTINSDITIKKEEDALQNLVLSKAQFVNQWLNAQIGEMQVAAESDVLKSMDAERMISYLQTLEKRSEVFETMFVLNTDGIVIAHSNPNSIGSDYSDRSYYPIALNGESTYSEVLVSKATGNRIIVGATPIKDDNGNVIGIMCGSANFEVLVDTILATDEDSTSNLILIDNLGFIQVAPLEELIGIHIDESNIEQESIDALKRSFENAGISSFKNSGENYLIAYAPIERVGYGLSINTPEDVVLKDSKTILLTVSILIAIAAIFIIILSILIVNSITKPILKVANSINDVAAGNLNVDRITLKNQDELGQLATNFNTMVENIKHLVAEIKNAAETVHATSEEFSASSEETLQASEQISASIQTISASTEAQSNFTEDVRNVVSNITNSITSITKNIEQTNCVANDAVLASETGSRVIHETIHQMKLIEEKTSSASIAINTLGEKSDQINEIISVITNIADQTNLLALNATIEAARAGEYGKGFAVVADEVRKLAEQSSEASGKISELIKDIQSEIAESVSAMHEGNSAVNDGIHFVERAGNEFSNISITVDKVSEHMQKILDESSRMKEQSELMENHIDQIVNSSIETTSNIQEISSASEEQFSAMQEIAAAADELAKMAEHLNITTQNFKF